MRVEKDKVVSIHYTLTLDSGELIDSSLAQDSPLNFLVGYDQIIPGLERSLMGLEVGDKKDVNVPPEEAYGLRNEELIQPIPRDQIPPEIQLQEGQILTGKKETGETVEVTVVSFDDDQVILDLNHPLAGKNLNFSVEIVDIREATAEELQHRHVH